MFGIFYAFSCFYSRDGLIPGFEMVTRYHKHIKCLYIIIQTKNISSIFAASDQIMDIHGRVWGRTEKTFAIFQ